MLHNDYGAGGLSRRDFLAMGALAAGTMFLPRAIGAEGGRKMTINLMPGMIGVRANQIEAIRLAHKHGFESVEPMGGYLAGLSRGELEELLGEMKSKGIGFGAAGLPVEFRADEERFKRDLEGLPRIAAGLERARVTRLGTWLRPGDNSLTYLQNFKQHARRLGEIAKVLRDHKIQFGLEYVGTKTLRDRYEFEFVHTMAETKELIAETGLENIGFVLDSWHWWNANEGPEDILKLRGRDVVAVDLNDAPAGIPKAEQMDNRRELPLATGVIPVEAFLKALQKIGCEAPVRAEPFNRELNEMDNDEACAKTSAALHKAFELLG
jgi:sugar phosphate isomerase/epimerase